MQIVETPNGPRKVVEVGDPLHFPVWKDLLGNLFMNPHMPLATAEEAEEAGRLCCDEVPAWGALMTFSHVYSTTFQGGPLELEHIDAGAIVPGLISVGGPVFAMAKAHQGQGTATVH